MPTQAGPKSLIVAVCDQEWKAMQPGIRMKTLWTDTATNRRAVLVRIEPGAGIALHRHVGEEFIYVIEGAVSDESGTVTAGDMSFRPNGCIHSVTSTNGMTVFALITGGIEPAKTAHGAPRAQNFILNEMAWSDFRPGIRQKRVWEDPPTSRRAVLSRFEPGAMLATHRHVGDELVFVIEGAISDESGAVTAGNFSYRPDGCVHSVTSKNGATAVAIISGHVEPV
jgi:anti-sigma factor ChrR (cupin superfamily)